MPFRPQRQIPQILPPLWEMNVYQRPDGAGKQSIINGFHTSSRCKGQNKIEIAVLMFIGSETGTYF